jgi:hypothetical protein
VEHGRRGRPWGQCGSQPSDSTDDLKESKGTESKEVPMILTVRMVGKLQRLGTLDVVGNTRNE